MEKLKKTYKKEIKLFLIILILASFLCLGFLISHKITDSYWNIQDGYDIYKLTPLKDGRIIHYIILSIVSKTGIPMEAWILISQYISLIIYSVSILNIYKVIKSIADKKIKEESKKKRKVINIVILLASFLIILNPMTVECFAYVENIIMSLSILLITYASKTLYENKRYAYIKTLVLMILAALSYQGTLNMWILLSILFFTIDDEDKKGKDWAKYLFKMATIIIILLLSIMAVLKIGELFTNENQERIGNFSLNIIKTVYLMILGSIQIVTTSTFNLFPEYLICSIILITLILLFVLTKKNTKSIILKYLFCIFIIIASCIVPVFLQRIPAISARISLAIGGIIGFSIIYTLFKTLNSKEKNIAYILLVISIIYLSINIFDYYNLAIMNQITNQEDEKFCKEIDECIIEYEENSEYEVKNVIFIRGGKDTYNNLPQNTFTQKTLLAVYANLHCLNYYTGRDLEKIEVTKEIYKMHTKSEEWTKSKNENINFYKETLYVVVP